MRIARIILALALCLSSSLFASEWTYDKRLGEIQSLILELRLDEAERRLTILKKEQSDNLYIDLLEARIVFFRAFIPDDGDIYDRMEDRFDGYLKAVKGGSKRDVHTYIASSELYLIKAFLEMRYGNNLGTAWNGYMAWDQLEEAIRLFPDHPLVRYGNGLLQATVGSLPENYQFFTRLIGMKGSVAKGLEWMETSLEDPDIKANGVYFDEFAYMLCQVRYQLQDDSDKLLSEYGVQVKGSSFLLYMECLQLLQRGENDKAATLLITRPIDQGRINHPFMELFTGKVLLNRQDPMASKWLKRYLEVYRGKNHRKAVYRYLFWHYGLIGAYDQAEKYKSLAKSEELRSPKDRQAEEDLKENLPWPLIRARLLFDGGYDDDALSILNDPTTINKSTRSIDKLELNYRLGRILFRQEKWKEAEIAFQVAVSFCDGEQFNCSNSWLHLGFIAEKKGDLAKAKRCYEAVLDQEDFAYFEGLQQKARASLERIK